MNKRQRIRKCIVCGIEFPKEKISLFRFPPNEIRSKLWVNSLSEKKELNYLKDLSLKELKLKYVCEFHFEENCFTSTIRNRIGKFAVPTLMGYKDNSKSDSQVENDPEPSKKRLKLTEQDTEVMSSNISSPLSSEDNLHNYDNSILSSITSVKTSVHSNNNNVSSQNSPKIQSLQITPKTRKIRNLRTTVSKLKRRIIQNSKKINKFSISRIMEDLKEKMPYNQFVFVNSQIRQLQRKPTGRCWTKQEKVLALNIYQKSPSAYRALKHIVNLPTIETLRKSVHNIGNKPGFCPLLLKSIKSVTAKMNSQQKLCILSFDEMSIKSGLNYSQSQDRIIGFEHLGTVFSEKLATAALVFMVRGLCKQWKQPIGYFFAANTTTVSELKVLLFEAISKITEAGLDVIALVCDQAPTNVRLYSELNITNAKPFIEYNGKRIFTFFDAPHLIKSVRNNLKKYDVIFNNDKTAKWRYINDFYSIDCQQVYRVAPRLTNAHMDTKGLTSMRVKLATQVLSHSVAAGISLLVATGHLPPEAAFTAEFVGEMDELFDTFNSRSFLHSKELAAAVTNDSKHLEIWHKKLQWINSWQFIKKRQQENYTCMQKRMGFIHTFCHTIMELFVFQRNKIFINKPPQSGLFRKYFFFH